MSNERPLSGYELDDIRNWAKSAAEDDSGDELPPLVLRLIQEHAELRELLRCEEKSGRLAIIDAQAKKIDELSSNLRQERAFWENTIKGAKTAERAAREKVEKCAAIMLEVEKLMAMARESIVGTEAGTVESLSSLATKMEAEYERGREEVARGIDREIVKAAQALLVFAQERLEEAQARREGKGFEAVYGEDQENTELVDAQAEAGQEFVDESEFAEVQKERIGIELKKLEGVEPDLPSEPPETGDEAIDELMSRTGT